MHKGCKHTGKIPQGQRQTRDVADRIKSLQKKLEKAIDAEDFELAAQCRDDINRLKSQLTGPAAA
jgi:protein-arginine kinase activator protein McsA